MNISRERKVLCKLEDYETYAFSVSVFVSHHDLGFSNEDVETMSDEGRDRLWEDLNKEMETRLEQAMLHEIGEALWVAPRDLVGNLLPALSERYIKEEETQPRRTRRRRGRRR